MNHRKIAVVAVAVFLCGTIGYLTFVIAAKRTRQREVAKKTGRLPSVRLTYTNGTSALLDAHNRQPVVLVLFNSGCEHCQYEAKAIRRRITDFAHTQVVLVSVEEMPAVRQFAAASGLANTANVRFATISHTDLASTFGTVSFPSVYVYGAGGRLLRHFRGETSPQVILNVVSASAL